MSKKHHAYFTMTLFYSLLLSIPTNSCNIDDITSDKPNGFYPSFAWRHIDKGSTLKEAALKKKHAIAVMKTFLENECTTSETTSRQQQEVAALCTEVTKKLKRCAKHASSYLDPMPELASEVFKYVANKGLANISSHVKQQCATRLNPSNCPINPTIAAEEITKEVKERFKLELARAISFSQNGLKVGHFLAENRDARIYEYTKEATDKFIKKNCKPSWTTNPVYTPAQPPATFVKPPLRPGEFDRIFPSISDADENRSFNEKREKKELWADKNKECDCIICMEKYDSVGSCVILPCGHSLCTNCFTAHTHIQGKNECPQRCTQKIKVSDYDKETLRKKCNITVIHQQLPNNKEKINRFFSV